MIEFRIADTFTASLARLAGQEQKAVKISVFDLQASPSGAGLSFHRLDRARDRSFWSVRASDDIRIIVHRTAASLLICYAGHHDDAYRWAERRRIERHPMTGAAQLVEIRERVQEIVHHAAASVSALFADMAANDLLALGVPPAWVAEVKQATEDTLLDIAPHLPAEAAEALLQLATGGSTARAQQAYHPLTAYRLSAPRAVAMKEDQVPWGPPQDGFAHPDAQRRFRLITNSAELARALDFL